MILSVGEVNNINNSGEMALRTNNDKIYNWQNIVFIIFTLVKGRYQL